MDKLAITVETHPAVVSWVNEYIPPEHRRLFTVLFILAYGPWWKYISPDTDTSLASYTYAMYVMLPNEPLWTKGGVLEYPTGDEKEPRIVEVAPLSLTLAQSLVTNAQKLMTRQFKSLSERDEQLLEIAAIDPLIVALHGVFGGVGMTDAIEALYLMHSQIQSGLDS